MIEGTAIIHLTTNTIIMDSEDFSPQQNIDLIQRMISKAKNTVADSSVFSVMGIIQLIQKEKC